MRIKALIVDDEPHARFRIKKYLEDREDFFVLGECKNGAEAIREISNKKPDVVFLDISMPDMNGFDVLSKIKSEEIPYIIFTTAYDSYAINAFNIHAIDYLLKPFDEERFSESIKKIIEKIEAKETLKFKKRIKQLLNTHDASESKDYFSIQLKHKGRTVKIDFEEIYYFEASGNYVKMKLENKSYLYRSSMSETEQALSNLSILRIHRSYILNTHYIENVHYLNNNEYEFTLKNGDKLKSGRTYKNKISEYLNRD